MIKIISFVDSYKDYQILIDEYLKRLWKQTEVIKLKPSKKKNSEEIIKEETSILREYLSKIKWYKILLSIAGEIISTETLLEIIESKKQNYPDIIFVIWWSYWLDENNISTFIDYKLSISLMTFPHLLAITILLEQIYRVSMIERGSGYHH